MSEQVGCHVLALLVDDAVLPGESHYRSASWDDEVAIAAGVISAGDQVVLLPRELLHEESWPVIGLLATFDSLRRGGDGVVESAKLFGLGRVQVLRLVQRQPHLVVETRELAAGTPPSERALRRLQRLIGVAIRGEFRSISSAHAAELRTLPPDQATDRIGAALSPDSHARLTLLRAVDWPDRLDTVAKLIGQRPRGLRHRTGTLDLDQQVKRAKLPKVVREAAERALQNQLGRDGASNRDLVRLVLDMRWETPLPSQINLARARSLLDASHSDLGAVKEAVLDYLGLLAWHQHRGQTAGTALGYGLCLVGPPGVGKTTIAAAIGRRLGQHRLWYWSHQRPELTRQPTEVGSARRPSPQ